MSRFCINRKVGTGGGGWGHPQGTVDMAAAMEVDLGSVLEEGRSQNIADASAQHEYTMFVRTVQNAEATRGV